MASITWLDSPDSWSDEQRLCVLNALLAHRCENYGYNREVMRRLSRQRAAARKPIQLARDYHFTDIRSRSVLHWNAIANGSIRVCTRKDETRPVGAQYRVHIVHNTNEAVTHMLRVLINPDARYLDGMGNV